MGRRCDELHGTDSEIFKSIDSIRKTLFGFLVSLLFAVAGLAGNIYVTWLANKNNTEVIKQYSKEIVHEIQLQQSQQ